MIAGMSFPRPFGRYVLEERIALGGMAEIFRARTRAEGFSKRICIKRILPSFLDSTDFVTMFRDEAALAARLTHANVVQVFDFGEEEESLYLAMEFVDGADLRTLMKQARLQSTHFSIEHAVQIGVEMCRGLHYAHTLQIDSHPLQIVHRDISPHNVLVSRAGEIKITDFGIAKAAARSTHTGTGVIKGKLAYMAPEQVRAEELDHRVDLFATGIVLWEMLTGARLYQAEDEVALLQRVLACEIPAPSSFRNEIPKELDDIVLKSLAVEPNARFENMHIFEKTLTRFLLSYTQDPDALDLRNLVRRFLPNHKPARKTAVMPLAPALQAAEAQKTPSQRSEDSPAPRTASIFTDAVHPASGSTDIDRDSTSDWIADSTFPDQAPNDVATASLGDEDTSDENHRLGPVNEQEVTADTRTWSSSPPAPAIAPMSQPEAVLEALPDRLPVRPADKSVRLTFGAATALVGIALGTGWLLSNARSDSLGQIAPDEVHSTSASSADGTRGFADENAVPSRNAKSAQTPVPQIDAMDTEDSRSPDTSSLRPETVTKPAALKIRLAPSSPVAEGNAQPKRLKPGDGARTKQERAPVVGKAWIEMEKGWAHVYLGTKKLCETPCYVTLPVGTHTLVFESSYEGRFSRKVRIRPEEALRLEISAAAKSDAE